MMRRRIVIILGWALSLMLAGCGSLPTSGPIETVDDVGGGQRSTGIDLTVQPPAPDATPEAIIEGFLGASESPADGYAVARTYLTDEAASSWRPEVGIDVYDASGQSRVITSDGSAVIRAPLVGSLDEDHIFTAASDTEYVHNFELTRVDDQWRITNPGDGILMSRQRFQQAFLGVLVYFLDPAGDRLVPQQVFLRQNELSASAPDALVRAVIRGPGTWIRPAVTNVLPEDVTSAGTWVDEQGVAHVALSEQIEALSADQRVQAAAQLLFTLSYFESITGLQINVNNRPLSIRGADDNGVVRFSTLAAFNPRRPMAPRDLYAVHDAEIIKLPDNAAAGPIALPGALGESWEQPPRWLAVSWQGDQVSVVDADGSTLYRANTADGELRAVYEGSALTKPQFDSEGRLWTLDNTPAGVIAVVIGKQDEPLLVAIPELESDRVVSFRISPGLARMVVIVESGETEQFGMLRLRGTDELVIDGWRRLPLNTTSGQITVFRDVVFTSSAKMMVVGADERDAQFSVYSVDIDAAQVAPQGPLYGADVVALTAMPRDGTVAAAVLTATDLALRFESQYRWQELLDDVTALAYPS